MFCVANTAGQFSATCHMEKSGEAAVYGARTSSVERHANLSDGRQREMLSPLPSQSRRAAECALTHLMEDVAREPTLRVARLALRNLSFLCRAILVLELFAHVIQAPVALACAGATSAVTLQSLGRPTLTLSLL